MRDTVSEQYLAKMGFLRNDYLQLKENLGIDLETEIVQDEQEAERLF